MNLPPQFASFIIDIWQEDGRTWLQNLPGLITEFERRWSFTAGPPFPDLSYNYVAPVRLTNGTEAVLKLGLPRPEIHTEIEALRHYNGRGIARLLQSDPQKGALLLERLRPGQMLLKLSEKDDQAATEVAAALMKHLWRPLPDDHPFPTIADWGRGLTRLRDEFPDQTGSLIGPFPKKLVQQAETHYRELTASMAPPVLLHGDLHHWNIMTAQREPWLAIDPKGLAGEPAYEVGPLLYNPVGILLTWPNPQKILTRRIDILTEHLNIDRRRITGWAIYQCLLSAWWSYEDQGYGWEEAIAVGEIIMNCK